MIQLSALTCHEWTFNVASLLWSKHHFPISEIIFPISAQLVPISCDYGLFFMKSLWMFLGKLFEFFFHVPCWVQGAFLSAAFTNHILMSTSRQPHLHRNLRLAPRSCHINILQSTVAACNPDHNFLIQRVESKDLTVRPSLEPSLCTLCLHLVLG